MTVAIRRLGAADAEAFRAIRLEALAAHPGNYFRPLADDAARPLAEWRARLASPDQACFGLFDGDALVGITAVYLDAEDSDPAGPIAWLGMSYIAPSHRGRGLAGLLYDARIE